MFELVVGAAVGQAKRQYDSALAALAAATFSAKMLLSRGYKM